MLSFFLGDDFNAGVSEKGGNWTAPQWISEGFETAMLWPLDGVLFTSPKHTLGSSLKSGEPLGMMWRHPWPEELLRKPACGRYFEAGGPATGSRSPTIRNVPRVPERREGISRDRRQGGLGALWGLLVVLRFLHHDFPGPGSPGRTNLCGSEKLLGSR